MPLDMFGPLTRDGMPFVAPEVQLYYKARAPQPKDGIDFTATHSVLTRPQRRWLLNAVITTYGNHLWAASLRLTPAERRRPSDPLARPCGTV